MLSYRESIQRLENFGGLRVKDLSSGTVYTVRSISGTDAIGAFVSFNVFKA
jgi:hypothetical protein